MRMATTITPTIFILKKWWKLEHSSTMTLMMYRKTVWRARPTPVSRNLPSLVTEGISPDHLLSSSWLSLDHTWLWPNHTWQRLVYTWLCFRQSWPLLKPAHAWLRGCYQHLCLGHHHQDQLWPSRIATILPPSSTATIFHTTLSPKSAISISRFCFESDSYSCMYLSPYTIVMNPKSVQTPNMRTERCFVDKKLGENYSYLQKRRLLTKTDLSTDFAKVLSPPTINNQHLKLKWCKKLPHRLHTFSKLCKS